MGKVFRYQETIALNMQPGEICVIADDDVRYTYEYFDKNSRNVSKKMTLT